MIVVNMAREMAQFYTYAANEMISGTARLLWYALFNEVNKRAQGSLWPDGPIRLSNDYICAMSGIGSVDTLARARNELKQRGLLQFKSGRRGNAAPEYTLIYLTAGNGGRDNTDLTAYPHPVSSGADSDADSDADSVADSVADIYLTETETETRCEPNVIPLKKDEDENTREIQDARAETEAAWAENYGNAPSPGVAGTIAATAERAGFARGIVSIAISEACRATAQNPTRYILTLLSDWARMRLYTPEEVEDYISLRGDPDAAEQLRHRAAARLRRMCATR